MIAIIYEGVTQKLNLYRFFNNGKTLILRKAMSKMLIVKPK